jgi:hypothetical protein
MAMKREKMHNAYGKPLSNLEAVVLLLLSEARHPHLRSTVSPWMATTLTPARRWTPFAEGDHEFGDDKTCLLSDESTAPGFVTAEALLILTPAVSC